MLIQRLQGDIEKEQGVYYEFDVHSKPIGTGGMGKVYLGSKVVPLIEILPKILISYKSLNSYPNPNVPEAGIIGFLNS